MSRTAPPHLAARLQSLPPILHRSHQSPMQSCSKGARGLSVLQRGDCIITNTSTSLSLRRRQCGHRYAIRAGRNLPDKEFRYLRTVIVTAARALVFTPQLSPPDFPKGHAYTLKPGRPTPGLHNLLRLPIASCGGTGILTSFPSTTRFRLVLGADSPCADERCAGNLGLTATELFTLFIATHVSIRTSDTSSNAYASPSQAYGTLSYQCKHSEEHLHPAASVYSLSPVT